MDRCTSVLVWIDVTYVLVWLDVAYAVVWIDVACALIWANVPYVDAVWVCTEVFQMLLQVDN